MCEVYETLFRETLEDFQVSEEGRISGYCNSAEEIEKLLNDLKTVGFSYSVRSSHIKQPSTDMNSKNKFFFHLRKGHVEIPFVGPAFAVESTWSRQCILGPKYYQRKETCVPAHLEDHVNPSRKRMRVMDTIKSGCPATIYMKSARFFTDFALQSVNECFNTKSKVIGQLRNAMASQPRSYLRFYVSASPANEHTHTTESVEASGNIHPLLIKEIQKLVLNGTTSKQVIKLALDSFIDNFFTAPHKPSRMNTTFYPTDKTIYTHICRALYGTRKTLFDESRLKNQVDEWHKESNNHMIYYRHCTDDNGEVKPLLFCYQSSWQRELLKKYGRSCLLDATYKTTTYDIPLFFIAVKGNVGYFVVGFFFIQVENARSIHEALDIFKGWNEDWNPTYWVTDFSESEIKAIEQAFPQTKVYLCLFHRKQAWGRWLKKRDNLCVPQDMKTFEDMWQHISESPTESEFRIRTEVLRTHEVSRRNKKAWQYFVQQWLSVCERWVKAFEDKGGFDTIDTTNGVETMNKLVKHFFLKYNTDRTLTGVTKVLINEFLPSLYKKYRLLNSSIKSYKDEIPVFLHKKTKHFVTHVMKRYAKAEVDLSPRSVTSLSDGLFFVKSAEIEDRYYTVNFNEPSCGCEDFQREKYPCKHFCAIFMFYPEWGFDKLPENYRNDPLICLDEIHGVGSAVISHEGSTVEGPVEVPAEGPSEVPAEGPSEVPAEGPSEVPAEGPSEVPAEGPSEVPAEGPSEVPAEGPSEVPAEGPSEVPAEGPSEVPAEVPAEGPKLEHIETSKIHLLQFGTREVCRQISNLTYNCSNSELLQEMLDTLTTYAQRLQSANPEVGGLPLAAPSTTKQ